MKIPKRPENQEEFQKREAAGTIRASRFVRVYSHSRHPITIDTILAIHKEIFKDAWLEIAGVFRIENLEITESRHKPPHYSKVPVLMEQADTEFRERLSKLKSVEGLRLDKKDPTKEELDAIGSIIESAAWIHHIITHIHPFREGNGRTARLAANLILERYGLVGISIKMERENKNRYLNSLRQIDQYGDYEPLMDIITEGIIDRYNGIQQRII